MVGLLAQSGLMRLADQMAAVVYGWSILEETGSGGEAGAVIAASFGVLILGAFFAGRLIARFGARPIALTGAWLSACAAAAIASLFVLDAATPFSVAILAALGAALDGPAGIATETNYPTMARLGRVGVLRLNAFDDGLDHVASLIAPAAGAALVAFAGAEAGTIAVALLALAAAVVLTVSLPSFRATPGAGAVRLRAVLAHLWRDRLLFALTVLLSLALGLFFALQLVLLPLTLVATGSGPEPLAAFMAATGAASIAGAAAAGFARTQVPLRATFAAAFVLLALGAAMLTTGSGEKQLALAGALMGLPAGIVSPVAATLYQTRPPKVLRADMQAVTGAFIFAGAPIAVLLTGVLADRFGAPPLMLAIAAALLLLAACAAVVLPPDCEAAPPPG